MPEVLAGWVIGTDSLTRRLRARCGERFSVQRLYEGWQKPLHGEARRLRQRPARMAWVREVALCCDGQPLILARSVIPLTSLRGRNGALRLLGNRPLGELLFSGAGTSRSPLRLARLRRNDALAIRLHDHCGRDMGGNWARQAVHLLHGKPLLVTEVFLPELVQGHG
nr:chorismate lyase [Methylonatrum kenyense]